ncbi:MAG: hypothetical protein AMXMBFR84_10890 [Candidatus Hydrogenedentota bacterium]
MYEIWLGTDLVDIGKIDLSPPMGYTFAPCTTNSHFPLNWCPEAVRPRGLKFPWSQG